jgi:hypothetical protein
MLGLWLRSVEVDRDKETPSQAEASHDENHGQNRSLAGLSGRQPRCRGGFALDHALELVPQFSGKAQVT